MTNVLRNLQPAGEKNVHADVRGNCRITLCELSKDVQMSCSPVQSIFRDLVMKCMSGKLVSKLLSADQKATQVAAEQDFLDWVKNNKNFLKMVITSDESWVCGYDSETKAQSL